MVWVRLRFDFQSQPTHSDVTESRTNKISQGKNWNLQYPAVLGKGGAYVDNCHSVVSKIS